MRISISIAALLLSASLSACSLAGDGANDGNDRAHPLDFLLDEPVPAHFPPPIIPEGSELTVDKVELGRYLFYDARLSVNETISCSSCHRQELAFSDGLSVSLGATGEAGALNAPTLSNAAYAHPLTWAHADIATIEEQLIGPMFGEAPVEMGMTGAEAEIVARLAAEPVYQQLFPAAFGESAPVPAIDLERVRLALSAFVRSLLSHRSPFDDFLAGDMGAISDSALRGSELFFSQRLGCGNCHAGFALSTAVRSTVTTGQQTSPFHNIGLYNVDGAGGYPEAAPGLIAETGVDRDMGRFRVPTLRNVALTAPYMHDGSVESLDEVIDIYEAGGRLIETGEQAGDGRVNPWRSVQLRDFELDDSERADLLAFLMSLTDDAFVSDERLADPW